jgi:16S rRNA (uracil1498-N3)-methyltransferase
MTRRRFYAPPEALSPGESAPLSAEETRHARDVLRLQRGEEVYVFDGEGQEYRCVIAQLNRDSVKVDVLEQVEPARLESHLHLTLCVALLKGEKFDLVVQKATELGATRFIPILTNRADVRIRSGEDARRKLMRWQRIALEATKQSGRARLMKIDAPVAFEELIERAEQGDELRLMFAEREGTSFSEVLKDLQLMPAKAIALIGPEGGWTDGEIDEANENGWRIVTLGGRTLRAETAAIVASTLLQHRCGDLV